MAARDKGGGLKIVAQADYLEFELEIGPGSGLEYPVAVIESPAGQAQGTMRFPFSDRVLESRLEDLRAALRGSRRRRPSLAPEQGQAGEVFGQALFDALFRGEIGRLYDKSWRQAAEQGKVLRLKLRVQSPELVTLPWEYLFDARLGEYLCLSHTSIVRYLEPSQAGQATTVTPPLRILGMIAGSPGLSAADAQGERQRLEEATNHLQALELVKLEWARGRTWRHLRQALGTDEWHVLYFVGDGGFDQATGESFIVLAGEDDRSERWGSARLGRLLASRASLRMVWLSTCPGTGSSDRDRFSSTATDLVQRGIPAVLTMQHELTKPAAESFAEALYAALAATMPLDLAVAKARVAIRAEGSGAPEWGIPALYTHSPDLRLFDKETLAETARQRGDAALSADEFERAITQYLLAIEMGAEAIDEDKVTLAREASRTVREAEELLRWSDGNVESLADEILKVAKDLEGLEQRLPDSQAIHGQRLRVQKKASGLRDRLWQDGQQMMRRRTIGLTLAGQCRQMQDSTRLLQKAIQLDQEENPALREDLEKAMRRLRYLENAQAQAKGEQGRRRRRIAIIGVVAVSVVLLACLAAGLAGAPSLIERIEQATPVARALASQTPESAFLPTDVEAALPADTATPLPSHTAQPTLAPETTAPVPPAGTATPLPANTASPAPSRTLVPTVAPSSTSEPTVTQEQTAEPTPIPTGTATTGPRSASPTPSPSGPPTTVPTPEIVYPSPGLIQPGEIVFLSQEGDTKYTMRWRWDSALQEDEWFDVRVWQAGMPHNGIAWTKQPEYVYDICLRGNGHFYWSVAVIRGQDGQWVGDLSPEAAPRLFSTSRSNDWCLDHGRWVQGPED
jgi:hypothetical protein